MAEVIGMTAEAINAITNALVQTGEVQEDGTIVLITLAGTRLPIGNIAVDPALAQIANLTPADLDMIQQRSGVWTNRTMDQVLADLGSDIHTIEGLTPANDDILQRKSGAWINRTIAQLIQDLKADPHFPQVALNTSSVNRTSSTLTDDPNLKFTLDPNSTYDITMDASTGGSAGTAYAFTVPSGVSGFHLDIYNQSGTGFGSYPLVWTSASNIIGLNPPGYRMGGYLVTGANGGTFAFKWGSATNGTITTLGTAILRCRKVSP